MKRTIDIGSFLLISSLWVAALAPGQNLGSYSQRPADAQPSATAEMSVKPPSGDHDLRPLIDTVARLKQIHTDSDDANIPPAAKPLLTTLKHQLRDLIGEILASEGGDASAQQIEARVIEELRRSGIDVREPLCHVYDPNEVDKGYDYGEIYNITVERPDSDLCINNLIGVTTGIGVLCGEDTSLYLFRHEGARWRLILREEANNYNDISGALGEFQYGISYPDEHGDFFVLAANVNPWCTSNWQSLRYVVLRPGPNPDEPRILLSEQRTIYLGDGESYNLKVTGKGFRLTFHSDWIADMFSQGAEVDMDDESSKRIVEYDVDGDRVTLVRDNQSHGKQE
jgi:hypothetical protein